MTPADWEAVLWETVAHLQALIRIDSVNPPGNEIGVGRYIDDVLRGAGIESQLMQPSRGRAAVCGRIRGTGRARPVLLLAHMDVVGVERDKWRTNPFGGEVLDGYVYGRGAIDDKGMLATNLEAMVVMQRAIAAGAPAPARDIVLVATSDEEAGGQFGIEWVRTHHPEWLDAEFALNEGGRVRIVDGRPLYCAIQCAEKVPHNVIVTARGPGGHAAVPHDGNAITRLARAVHAITQHIEPVALSDVTRGFFGRLATVWPDPSLRQAMAMITSPDARSAAQAAELLGAVPSFNAVLRNGISPTLISGGIRSNVIPTEASATLNIRVLPGASLEELIGRLRHAVGDPFVEFNAKPCGHDAPPSPVDSPMFLAIASAVRALDPNILPVPYLSTGATDSATLRSVGILSYGVLPFPLTQEDEDRMHGHDERVPVDALGFGVRLTHGILERIAFSHSA